MSKVSALSAVVLILACTSLAVAKANPGVPGLHNATRAGDDGLDGAALGPASGATRADTVSFGYYTIGAGGLPYAVLGQTWTFDHGAADPLEGWTSTDLTANDQTYWRQLTEAKWIAEGGEIGWPAMTGDGMVLCGATEGHADSLFWLDGRGYGNDWCQRLKSPPLVYDGTGTEELTLHYFSESELNYDYTKIWVESSLGTRIIINSPGFSGKIGIDTATGAITPPGGVAYTKTISNLDFGGGTASRTVHITIEFDSDGGLSDEDDSGPGADSFYGAIGVDEIGLTGANLDPPGPVSYGFETDLEGWTASMCPGIGAFMGVANRDDYTLVDPCACALAGKVLEMHNDAGVHPDLQFERCSTPIVDRTTIPGNYLDYNRIMAEWDFYADMPYINGVFCRPGWTYYPYENPQVPGLMQWSPRVGQNTWYYYGDTPGCKGPNSVGHEGRNIATGWGMPPDAQQVRFLYDLASDCDAFGVDPCSEFTNFTPILDNIRVRNVVYVNAPICAFEPGARFQDGFGQSAPGILSTTDPGNSDIVFDLHLGNPNAPTRLGDSLSIVGPNPISPATRWEAKLWFRLKRVGPGQTDPGNPGLANYSMWKNAVGPNVNYPNFAWGYMDSVEIPAAQRYRFCSYFREDSPGYSWGFDAGDKDPGNEMLPDGVFTPGTKVEYFITTNYVATPAAYYLYPDTTGRVYQEFEILPSYRRVDGVDRFPCVLYVNAESSARYYIQHALNVVLNGLGAGDGVPEPTSWDRYDYTDASSSWCGPLYRMGGSPPGNSGATIAQLLGYKLVMVSLGDVGAGTMERRDWQGFQQWLEATACNGNGNMQGFIVDGIAAPQVLNEGSPSLLNDTMGATLVCGTYNAEGCAPGETTNDQQNCVKVMPVAGTPFGPGIATDVFGNWCPEKESFSVLGTTGTGVGNKVFEVVLDGYQTPFAQVINDQAGTGSNYRSVIESFSYHRLTDVRSSTPGLGECVFASPSADTTARVTAAYAELENAIRWTLGLEDPGTQIGLCVNPCVYSGDVAENGPAAAVTRLYQNRPNPFNPRTAIKFSLAADGPAKLMIYDVNGRRIRILVDRVLKAGSHEAIWDGADDAGHDVTSGVYWSQLQAGDYSSNKKMVVLK